MPVLKNNRYFAEGMPAEQEVKSLINQLEHFPSVPGKPLDNLNRPTWVKGTYETMKGDRPVTQEFNIPLGPMKAIIAIFWLYGRRPIEILSMNKSSIRDVKNREIVVGLGQNGEEIKSIVSGIDADFKIAKKKHPQPPVTKFVPYNEYCSYWIDLVRAHWYYIPTAKCNNPECGHEWTEMIDPNTGVVVRPAPKPGRVCRDCGIGTIIDPPLFPGKSWAQNRYGRITVTKHEAGKAGALKCHVCDQRLDTIDTICHRFSQKDKRWYSYLLYPNPLIGRMSESLVWKTFNAAGGGILWPYLLRHAYGTDLYKKLNKDVIAMAHYMEWSDARPAMFYANIVSSSGSDVAMKQWSTPRE